jgi:ribulose kinase
MQLEYVIGIDEGTESVRASVFELQGKMVAYTQHEI